MLYVETRPSSPEQAAQYHEWYSGTHLREIVALDGFVAARRFAPLDVDGSFIAIYEIDADDIAAVQVRLAEVVASGRLSTPIGVELDPPPVVRFYRQIAEFADG